MLTLDKFYTINLIFLILMFQMIFISKSFYFQLSLGILFSKIYLQENIFENILTTVDQGCMIDYGKCLATPQYPCKLFGLT